MWLTYVPSTSVLAIRCVPTFWRPSLEPFTLTRDQRLHAILWYGQFFRWWSRSGDMWSILIPKDVFRKLFCNVLAFCLFIVYWSRVVVRMTVSLRLAFLCVINC